MTINAQKAKIDELTRVNKELTHQKSVNTETSIVDLNKIIALEEQMYGILIFFYRISINLFVFKVRISRAVNNNLQLMLVKGKKT